MNTTIIKENNISPKTIEGSFEDFIIKFHHAIITAIRTEALKYNFNMSQIEVLHYVIDKKNPTMKDIANHLRIKPPSVTPIVEFLMEKKLLKRVLDKNDNRISRVTITGKACKMFSKVKEKKTSMIKKMFQDLGIKDKKELMRILSLLNK